MADEAGTVGALEGVVLDYGDAAAEYTAVRSAAGVADRDDLGVIVLSGRDPVRMVHGLITNDLVAADEAHAVYAALLTPKGRTIAELRALKVRQGEASEVWVIMPREVLADATDHLRRSVPPLYARWRDASTDLAVLGVYGPRSSELLEAVLGSGVPKLAEDEVATIDLDEGSVRVLGTRYAGGEVGYDLLLDRGKRAELRARLLVAGSGWAREVGFGALEVLRIEAGRPRGGRELTQDTIPTEAFESTGLMQRAISFTKGCYTGQEVIVRIAHRGHVNRHLRGLVLSPAASARPGARVHHPESGKEVGWITSVALSPLMSTPIALAFVRREVELGTTVRIAAVEGPEAEVVELPFQSRAR